MSNDPKTPQPEDDIERLDDIVEMGLQQAYDEQDAEEMGVDVEDLYDDGEAPAPDVPPDTFGTPPKPRSQKQKDKLKAKKKMEKKSRRKNRK